MAVQSNKALITAHNIGKKYDSNIVLYDVSFSIAEEHIVGVIGPNGAGKSTLANIILGFDTDYDGSIKMKDDIRIAYIPQFSNSDKYVLPLSVYEFLRSSANKYYGLQYNITTTEISQALEHVGLSESQINQNVYSLSGGERQRVLIARALLSNPNFIVLDEPLASVDYVARSELYELLRHLNEEHSITMLLISHDVESIVSICNEVLCLNKTLHYGCHPTKFVSSDKFTHAVSHKYKI